MLSRIVSRAAAATAASAPAASSTSALIRPAAVSFSATTAPMHLQSSQQIQNNNMSTNASPSAAPKKELITYLTLNNIADNPGAIKRKRRIGRGIGSSKGKTSGRGHKGQKARAGRGVHPTFEGGQTKLYKRLPKRGFTNVHAEPMVPINVGTLQDYIDMGRLVPPKGTGPDDPTLTLKDLVDAGLTKASTVKHGIKLLGKGSQRLRTPIKIEASRASAKAIAAIERAGGSVTTVHYNRLALRALLKPEKFGVHEIEAEANTDAEGSEEEVDADGEVIKVGRVLPRRARPPPNLMPYYTSYEKRGYLSPEVQLKQIEARLGSLSVDDDSDDQQQQEEGGTDGGSDESSSDNQNVEEDGAENKKKGE